jgi:hypothetical protein
MVIYLLNGSVHGYLPGSVFPDGSTAENPSFSPGASGPNTIPVLGSGHFTGVDQDFSPWDWQGAVDKVLRLNTFATKDLADNHVHIRAALVNDWWSDEEHRGELSDWFITHWSNPSVPEGSILFDVARNYSYTEQRNNRFELDLAAEANFLGGRWETQAGADAYQYNSASNGYGLPAIQADGSPAQGDFLKDNKHFSIPAARFGVYDNRYKQDGYGFYLQEDAKFFNERLILSAGSRIDRYHGVSEDLQTGAKNDAGWVVSNKRGAPRYAVTVKPLKWLSVYGLYAKHFDPAQTSDTYFVDIGDYTKLPPEVQAQFPLHKIQSYSPSGLTKEVGVKASFFGGKVYASVCAFKQILGGQVTGLVAYNTTNPDGSRTQIGVNAIQAVQVSGAEAEIFGQFGQCIFVANYGITRGYGPPRADGSLDQRKPPATVSVHGEYDFAKARRNGAYVTAGATYYGPFLLGSYNVGPGIGQHDFYENDSQWSADAGIGYKWRNAHGQGRKLALTSTNVANKIILQGNPWMSYMPLRTVTLSYTQSF